MIIGCSGYANSGKDTVGEVIQFLTSSKAILEDELIPYKSIEEFRMNKRMPGYYNNSGWQIKKYANKLKQIASILTGIDQEKFEDQEFKKTYLGEEWDIPLSGGTRFLDKASEYYRNDIAYKRKSVREFLQKLGTDAIRNSLHPNTWVNALMSEYIPIVDRLKDGFMPCGDYYIKEEDFNRMRSFDKCVEYSKEIATVKVYPNWIITDVRFPNEAQGIKEREGIVIRINRFRTDEISPIHLSETSLDDWKFDHIIENNGTIEELIEKVRDMLKKLSIL